MKLRLHPHTFFLDILHLRMEIIMYNIKTRNMHRGSKGKHLCTNGDGGYTYHITL